MNPSSIVPPVVWYRPRRGMATSSAIRATPIQLPIAPSARRRRPPTPPRTKAVVSSGPGERSAGTSSRCCPASAVCSTMARSYRSSRSARWDRPADPVMMATSSETAAKAPSELSHSNRTGHPASGHGRSVWTTRTTTTPITARMPMVTTPARRGPSQPQDEDPGGDGGGQRPAEPDQQRGGDDPRGGGDPAHPPWRTRLGDGEPRWRRHVVASRRRSSAMRARHATTPIPLTMRARVSGSLHGPVDRDVDGTGAGRDPPPVEAAVDELRRPEAARCRGGRPGRVVALAEHEPAALWALRHGHVAAGPIGRAHRHGRRRGGLGRRRRGVTEDDAVDVEPGRGAGCRAQAMGAGGEVERSAARRRRSTAAPASSSATVASIRIGTGAPSTVSRSSRHPVSTRAGREVRAPIDSSLIAAGSTTGSA